MRSEADVVVIGGGVIGTAAAYYLSQSGCRVTLLEQRDLVSGASGANVGSIAVHTMGQGLVLQMAVHSARVYSSLSAELDWDFEYDPRIALVVIRTEEEWKYMQQLVGGQREAGLSAGLLGEAEVRELEPALGPAVIGAAVCHSYAQVNPQRLTLGYAWAARRLGAEILTHTPAIDIAVHGGRLVGVTTHDGGVATSLVVNAAGVGAPALGRIVGVDHPIRPRRGQALLTERRPGLPRTKVSSASDILAKRRAQTGEAGGLGLGFSLSPTPAGNLILGGTNEALAESVSTSRNGVRSVSGNVCDLVPRLGGTRVLRSWAGLRPVTEDGVPILGCIEGPEGYLVAAGHCGHGIGLAPATGQYITELVASGRTDITMSDFLAARA